jgi:F-type H+-transporting ATPase subunit b
MKSLFIGTVNLVVLAASAALFAAEEHHAAPISQIIYPAINFLIFAYILKRFALPPVMGFLAARRESVVKTVADAADEKRRAEAVVADYRSRLAKLDREIEGIRSELRTEGERDKARILREAEELAAKIKSDAGLQVEQEFKAARYRLRREIAAGARQAAQALLQTQITDADHKRLAEEFVANLGARR